MNVLFPVLVTFFAGMGAGLGTGFAGMMMLLILTSVLGIVIMGFKILA